MISLVRLGFLLLFSNIAVSVASDVTKCDAIIKAHDKLLKIQLEIARINAENSGKAHLTALEEDFKKLNELSDIRQQYVNGSCDIALQILMNLYGSIEEQMKALQNTLSDRKPEDRDKNIADIIETIKKKEFLKATQKLTEFNEWEQIPRIIPDVYANSEENFDLVIGLVEASPRPELSFSVLKSLHNEIQKNGLKDAFNLVLFNYALRDLKRHWIGTPEIEKEIDSISEGLLDTVKTTSTQYLVDALNAGDPENNAKVQGFSSILYDLNPAVYDEVMKRVVLYTYGRTDLKKILAHFFSLTYEAQTISAVSELLKKIRQSRKRGNDEALQVASHLKKLRNRDGFESLERDTKEAFEKVVMNLPTCARNVFFAPIVCLRSRATYTYLIAADLVSNDGKERRHILLEAPVYNGSLKGDVSPVAKWSVEEIDDKLKFRFKNNKFSNAYLHVAAAKQSPDKHYAISRPLDSSTDDQSIFKVDVDAEYCYLRSDKFNEYLIASEVMHKDGNSSTYVLSKKPDTTLEALFQIVEC